MRISYSLQAIGQKVADILAASGLNVAKWSGSNVAAPNVAGYPLVDTRYHRGTQENILVSGRRDVAAVKSIQYNAITITAGNTNNTKAITTTTGFALLIYLGSISTDGKYMSITLQDASTVRGDLASASAGDVTAKFVVIDFN